MSKKEILSIIEEIIEVKRLKKELETRQKALTSRIEGELDRKKVDRLQIGNYTISKSICNKTDLDREGLKLAYPEIIAEYTRFSTYVRLNIK